MKTKIQLGVSLCVILTAASNPFCAAAKPQNRLIGKWQQIGGNKIVQEFKPDGTTVSTSMEAPEPVTGKYEFDGESILKITNVVVNGRTESALFSVVFFDNGRRMKLENDSGFAATFEKLE